MCIRDSGYTMPEAVSVLNGEFAARIEQIKAENPYDELDMDLSLIHILVDLSQSDGYNPFHYLRDEKDALKLVNTCLLYTSLRHHRGRGGGCLSYAGHRCPRCL